MWVDDPVQERVIAYDGPGLLVSGAPGTGKTETLVRRIEHLLALGVTPEEILIVASEGSSRQVLREKLGRRPGLSVMTPAACALRCMDYQGGRHLATRFEEYLLLRHVLKGSVEGAPDWPAGNGAGVVQAVQECLGEYRRGEKESPDSHSFIARLDRFLQPYYARLGWLAHAEMVRRALTMGSRGPLLSGKYKHVLIDGLDLMGPDERALVARLSPESCRIAFAESEKQVPWLPEHYCLSIVHRSAGMGQPVFWSFSDGAEEAAGVARVIGELLDSGMEPGRILVLYRHYGSIGNELEVAFRLARIPADVQGGRPLVRGAGPRLLMHYFESLLDLDDDEALLRWLSAPLAGLDPLALARLGRGSRRTATPFEAFARQKSLLWPGLERLPALLDGRSMDAARTADSPLLELAAGFLRRCGVVERLLAGDTSTGSQGDGELYELGQFLGLIQEFDNGLDRMGGPAGESRVGMFVEACPGFWRERAAAYRNVPAVRVMGVHQARGVEADAVFVCGAVMGTFPEPPGSDPVAAASGLQPATGSVPHREVEEQLFRTALTRARIRLCVTCAARYGRSDAEPSPLAVALMGSPVPFDWGTEPPADEPGGTSQPGTETAPQAGRTLSHTAIKDYLSCPRRYFFGHVLRIQSDTTRGASLGNLVHDTLAAFHLKYPNLDRVEAGSAGTALMELFEESFATYGPELGPALVAGAIRQNARELLITYLEEMALPMREGRETVGLEREFELKVDGHRIKGRIDRVDRLSDGSFELVDYKTSTRDTGAILALKRQFLNVNDAENFAPADFQLPLYYLALSGEGSVTRLSYYQLAGAKARTFEVDPADLSRSEPGKPRITGADLDVIRKALNAVLTEMDRGVYPARARNTRDCQYCPYAWACTLETDETGAEEGAEA